MINAKELRIGNYIKPDHDLDGQFHRVAELTSNCINSYVESWYHPIPLTPEILEKCGFEKSKAHSLDYYKETGVGLNSFCFRINRPFKHEGNYYPEIKYLHELQNLFYWITRKELEINL